MTMITTTMMPIQNPFGSFCFTSSGVSNINTSVSLPAALLQRIPIQIHWKKIRCPQASLSAVPPTDSPLFAGRFALEIAPKPGEVHCGHTRWNGNFQSAGYARAGTSEASGKGQSARQLLFPESDLRQNVLRTGRNCVLPMQKDGIRESRSPLPGFLHSVGDLLCRLARCAQGIRWR